MGQARLVNGESKVLDDAWQVEHMKKLAYFILDLLDQADNVPNYLKSH